MRIQQAMVCCLNFGAKIHYRTRKSSFLNHFVVLLQSGVY